MKFRYLLVPAAALALAACGEGPTAQTEDVPSDLAATGEAPLPSNDLGNTYPSQTGAQSATSPGAEGGRGSAGTGETAPGQAGDPSAQQQTTP
ncbi:MAG: hypothetical protein H7124_04630 [Phycisphaerales bacterium]|nr:hypothetical protein [Hyphomonadaceae bacterium]